MSDFVFSLLVFSLSCFLGASISYAKHKQERDLYEKVQKLKTHCELELPRNKACELDIKFKVVENEA